jgi:hypothetical protein
LNTAFNIKPIADDHFSELKKSYRRISKTSKGASSQRPETTAGNGWKLSDR